MNVPVLLIHLLQNFFFFLIHPFSHSCPFLAQDLLPLSLQTVGILWSFLECRDHDPYEE